MDILLRLADLFRTFMVDTFVPFMTTVPDGIDVFYFSFTILDGFELRTLTIPWFFGDWTPAEFILVFGLIGFIGLRIIKVFWDALPFA